MRQPSDRNHARPHALIGGACTALLMIAAACGTAQSAASHRSHARTSPTQSAAPHRPHARTSSIQLPAHEPAGWSVSYPIHLPPGYGIATGLAVDPANDDAWFFAQGRDQRLFHWSRSRAEIVGSYRIGKTNLSMAAGEFTPITIDRSHRVWLGINQTVVVVIPGRAAPQNIMLPPVEIGTRGSGLPHPTIPNFGKHTGIDAIAPGPHGTIVTSRSFATELQTVDASTHAIGTVPLPHGTAISGLGAGDLAGDGKILAAALYTSGRQEELAQLIGGTWHTSTPCPVQSVVLANRTLAAGCDNCVAAGQLGRASGPVTLTRIAISSLPEETGVAVPSRGTVVATVPGGLMASTDGTRTPVISLGKVPAGPSLGGDHSKDPNRLVPIRALQMSSGTHGMLYFVPSKPGRIGIVQLAR